eukprot:COSAG01_NODE_37_length_34085_cov_64.376626_15_plen_145_part_00
MRPAILCFPAGVGWNFLPAMIHLLPLRIEDADIDREDEDPSDKKWLDQMWGRNKKKKKEKGIEEYKAIALRFKQRMEEAADDDEAANRRGEPALERLSMLVRAAAAARGSLALTGRSSCVVLRLLGGPLGYWAPRSVSLMIDPL